MAKRTCKIDECVKPAIGRGWCAMHYSRWRRKGDPHNAGQSVSRPKPQLTENDGGVQCPYCDGWYVNPRKLTIHCNRLHHEALPIKCEHCGRGFLHARGLQTHMGHAHPRHHVPRRNDPNVQREWNLRTSYGIGIEDYDRMLTEQDGGCATCGKPEAESWRRRLCVDHCHATGQVRGLLCANCNRAIGLASDDPELLDRMAAYLRRASE